MCDRQVDRQTDRQMDGQLVDGRSRGGGSKEGSVSRSVGLEREANKIIVRTREQASERTMVVQADRQS